MKNAKNPILELIEKKPTVGVSNYIHIKNKAFLFFSVISIKNDIFCTQLNSFQIIFGFNDSGKTTLLKTVALNIILAQIGIYLFLSKFFFQVLQIFINNFFIL